MADDRLASSRSVSIVATSSDKLALRLAAISLSPVQNASSRLTLVLWPPTRMERLTTRDFIVIAGLGGGGTAIVASFRLPDGPATDGVGEIYEAAGRRNVLGITSKSNPPAARATDVAQRRSDKARRPSCGGGVIRKNKARTRAPFAGSGGRRNAPLCESAHA